MTLRIPAMPAPITAKRSGCGVRSPSGTAATYRASRPGRSLRTGEESGEADLVARRVAHVEIPLAPGCVGRRRLRRVARGDERRVRRVDVGDPEDRPAPDRVQWGVVGVQLQVEEPRP